MYKNFMLNINKSKGIYIIVTKNLHLFKNTPQSSIFPLPYAYGRTDYKDKLIFKSTFRTTRLQVIFPSPIPAIIAGFCK
jgi:hypothetical protein